MNRMTTTNSYHPPPRSSHNLRNDNNHGNHYDNDNDNEKKDHIIPISVETTMTTRKNNHNSKTSKQPLQVHEEEEPTSPPSPKPQQSQPQQCLSYRRSLRLWLLGFLFVKLLWRSFATLQQFTAVSSSSLSSSVSVPPEIAALFASSTAMETNTDGQPLQQQGTAATTETNDNHDDDDSNQKESQPVIAACLMVMDENHRLPEWLAYHSYLLPLQHVVLLVDPRSEQSPLDIVQQWRSLLTIDVWTNHSYLFQMADRYGTQKVPMRIPKSSSSSSTRHRRLRHRPRGRPTKHSNTTTTTTTTTTTKSSKQKKPESLTTKHRRIQPLFYRTCGTMLQRHYSSAPVSSSSSSSQNQNQKQQQEQHGQAVWITFHDVDEYLSLDPRFVPHAQQRMMSSSGSIRTYLQELIQYHQQYSQYYNNNHHHRKQEQQQLTTTTPPSMSTSQDITKNQNNQNASIVFSFINQTLAGHCLVVERTYFGATERRRQRRQKNIHPDDETNDESTAAARMVDTTKFETLRYVYRTSHSDYENNGPPKVMTFFNSDQDSFIPWKKSVHRVLTTCPHENPKHQARQFSPLRIRHYLGSWQAYTSRVDARRGNTRSREIYLFRSQMAHQYHDPTIQDWIHGFYRQLLQLVKERQQEQQSTTNAETTAQAWFHSLLHGVGEFPASTVLSDEPPPTNTSTLLLSPPSPWNMPPTVVHSVLQNQKQTKFGKWLRQRLMLVPVNAATTTTNATTMMINNTYYQVQLRPKAPTTATQHNNTKKKKTKKTRRKKKRPEGDPS